jgi:hypothetical protein
MKILIQMSSGKCISPKNGIENSPVYGKDY